MDDAQPILEYLPASYKNRSDGEYITFLWEAFESNYQSGKYQFAVLACHMLYMSVQVSYFPDTRNLRT